MFLRSITQIPIANHRLVRRIDRRIQEGVMTREERREKLESFGHAPALLSAALRQFPKKKWLYKISQDRWSIHETILYLADSGASA
jgi:hypothetical protein